jgi:hypothetical protein
MAMLIFIILLSLFQQTSARDIWTVEQAQAWFQSFPYIQGSQYITSDAGNQLEMFQNDSWNPTLIDIEFGLAEALGSNTMRVFLHDLAYEVDKVGFMSRVNTLLDLAEKHGLKLLLVIFDSCYGSYYRVPVIGQQVQPVPGVMMSRKSLKKV